MSVFERYIIVRKELKITQGEIAKAIGITQGALSQQEQLKNVAIEALEYIRKTYNVNMNWLFDGKGAMIDEGNIQLSNDVKEWIKKHDELQILVEELSKDISDLIKERGLLRNKLKKTSGDK